jgi:alpha-mannosidase
MKRSNKRGYALPLLWVLAFGVFQAVLPDSANSQQKRIYIANDDHTDYVWTANEAAYKAAFLQMLDYYLDQADATDTLASDFQGRFNADGNFWMWTYEKNRTPAQFDRLISRIRDGHITVPLQTLVLCYGAMPAEAVLRSMYYAGRIERARDLRFELVSAMENQTFPFGLPSLWAGAGAKYSWKGVCGCATRVPNLVNRGREIYYAVGPDGKRVLMKWHSIVNDRASGGYAEARFPSSAVEFATSDSTFLSRYPFDRVVGMFGKGWDDFTTFTDEFITTAQSLSSPVRRVIVSNEVDFFRDFETSAPPDSIPSYSAGFGNEWELYCATMAEVTASVKRSVEDLRAAEALATYVSRVNPTFLNSRAASADSAFTNMGLFYEHDWTADGPSSSERPAFQRRLASQISGYISSLKSDAASALAGYIQNPGGNRFYVFNSLGWARTDIADIPNSGSGPFRVVDVTSGSEVRCQRITLNSQQYVRILAENVPSMGYRIYEIQPATSQFSDTAASFSNGNATFENDKYRVTVNGRGAIGSLIDKRDGNREWVQSIGGQLMNDLGSGSGSPASVNVGPVSATIYVNAGGSPQHTAKITLYNTIDRIDLEDEISSNFGDAVTTYSFGFNLSGYTVRHEEIGAIATVKTLSQGGSYSNSQGRYEYLTMNHFVDLSDGQRGMTLSNWDSPFFKLGNTLDEVIDGTTPRIRAVVGGRIDPGLGVANQNGDSYFRNRYSLRRHGHYDQAQAMRMAMEHQNPFVTAMLTGGPSGQYPGTSHSLAVMSDSSVILWALKPAEEGIGEGIIARVWNLAQNPSTFTLGLSDPITGAYKTTHIETNTGIASVSGGALAGSLAEQEMQTYRLLTSGSLPNIPPATTLTAPASGSSFTAPATIQLTAAASDSDGTITRLVFVADSAVVGVDSTSPYSVFWSDVPAGVYTLRARAFDNAGDSGISSPVAVVVDGGPVTLSVAVESNWNLLSLPLRNDLAAVPGIFPTATSWWKYVPGAGYVSFDTMRVGTGYWMKFPQGEVVPVSGQPVAADTAVVEEGWNIVGSVSLPLPATAITTIPPNLIGSLFYSFSVGYQASDTLLPGRGYWVRLIGSGEIVLGAAGNRAGDLPVSAADLRGSWSSLRIRDAAGNAQTLFFRVGIPDTSVAGLCTMPPPAPGEFFDARFETGRFAEVLEAGKSGGVGLKISHARYPLTMSWHIAEQQPSASLSIDGSRKEIAAGGSLQVARPGESIRIESAASNTIPGRYSLESNFPNPFNPRTSIRYALPFRSKVRIDVYDVLGKHVATLVDGFQDAGFCSAEWNATNGEGRQVASGIYLLRLEASPLEEPAGTFVQVRKMVFVR